MKQPTSEQIAAVEEKARVDDEIVRQILARVPPSWRMVERLPHGGAFVRANLQVIYTVQRYEQRGVWDIWIHASVCARIRGGAFQLPDWEDVKRVKNDFVGADRWAYQVFPAAKDYVNENAYVLHLYAKLEGEPALPDFTWGLGRI